ncbi:hypothetical protein COU57_00445 [Candidatus Pacearchaeota archaeon CG10_big_fil_rev_8_21_14_0_10_32_14]|nr:MAG: hypothetical protein COU57_00445 [Candidatus Pacearchaeota archaeon CG10_big_fil_rev_8_21_14_0_10_32_14]
MVEHSLHIQLGKNGVTDNFIETLKLHFKNHGVVRISVLKSATRDKTELKKWCERILSGLGKNYTIKTIGYTVIVKKWRKDVRK